MQALNAVRPVAAENRADFLTVRWIEAAKAASLAQIQSEDPAPIVNQFVAFASSKHFRYPLQEIELVQVGLSYRLEDRLSRLAQEKGASSTEEWRSRNSCWALPQEFDAVERLFPLWVEAAKEASLAQIRSGSSSGVFQRFYAIADAASYTAPVVAIAMRQVPHEPLPRLTRLHREFEATHPDRALWRSRNAAWAAPEEFKIVEDKMTPTISPPAKVAPNPGSIITQLQAPAGMSPYVAPVVEQQPTPIPTTPVSTASALSVQIHTLLERMYKVKFLHVGDFPGNGRIKDYRFKQDLAAKDEKGKPFPLVEFDNIQSRLPPALTMHSGLPEDRSAFVAMGAGHFSVQIPAKGWLPERDGISIETIAPLFGEETRYLDASAPFRIPIGKMLDGSNAWWEAGNRGEGHLLIGGSSGSGKSRLISAIIYYVTRLYHPGLVQLALVDPQALSLKVFSGLPWIWEAERRIRSSRSQIDELLDSIEKEMEIRSGLLAERDAESLADHNKRFPKTPLHRLVALIDEFPKARKAATSSSRFDDVIAAVGMEGEKLGVHLILGTQDASAGPAGSFTPQLRDQLGTRVCFRDNGDSLQKMVLGSKFEGATDLLGSGDGFILKRGMKYPRRMQAFTGNPDLVDRFKGLFTSDDSFRRSMAGRRPEMKAFTASSSLPLETLPPVESVSLPNLELLNEVGFKEIREAILSSKKEGGKISATRIMEILWGAGAGGGSQFAARKQHLGVVLKNNGYDSEPLASAIQSLADDS